MNISGIKARLWCSQVASHLRFCDPFTWEGRLSVRRRDHNKLASRDFCEQECVLEG